MSPTNFCKTFTSRAIFLLALAFLSDAQNALLVNDNSNKTKHDIDLLQIHEVNYIWTVDKWYFNMRRRLGENSIHSPLFSANTDDQIKWRLELTFQGEGNRKRLYFKISLSSDSKKSTAWIMDVGVDFWDDEQRTVSLWHHEFLNGTMTEFSYNEILTHDTALNGTIFSKNKVVISCKFKYCIDLPAISFPRQTKSATHQPSTATASTLDSKFSIDLASLHNGSVVAALLPLHEATYIWTVDRINFEKIGLPSLYLDSPIFSAITDNKLEFYLRLYPFQGPHGNRFGLYLQLSPNSKQTSARITLDLNIWSDEQRTVSIWNWGFPNTLKEITSPSIGWGTDGIPKNITLLFSNSRLEKNLTISCNVRYLASSSFIPYYRNNHLTNQSNSFATLFNISTYADIVLLVNETEYPAHKAILAAQSPVFAAIFEHEVKKSKKLKRRNITDMNERVAGEMLRYIYTGKCENLPQIADQLLVAADKYGLNDLKIICGETIYKYLTVKNAAKTLALANKHLVADLKAKTVAFIARKYAAVSNTTDWQRTIKESPELVHDVCHHQAGLLKNAIS